MQSGRRGRCRQQEKRARSDRTIRVHIRCVGHIWSAESTLIIGTAGCLGESLATAPWLVTFESWRSFLSVYGWLRCLVRRFSTRAQGHSTTSRARGQGRRVGAGHLSVRARAWLFLRSAVAHARRSLPGCGEEAAAGGGMPQSDDCGDQSRYRALSSSGTAGQPLGSCGRALSLARSLWVRRPHACRPRHRTCRGGEATLTFSRSGRRGPFFQWERKTRSGTLRRPCFALIMIVLHRSAAGPHESQVATVA